jgi:hypothetical protein
MSQEFQLAILRALRSLKQFDRQQSIFLSAKLYIRDLERSIELCAVNPKQVIPLRSMRADLIRGLGTDTHARLLSDTEYKVGDGIASVDTINHYYAWHTRHLKQALDWKHTIKYYCKRV